VQNRYSKSDKKEQLIKLCKHIIENCDCHGCIEISYNKIGEVIGCNNHGYPYHFVQKLLKEGYLYPEVVGRNGKNPSIYYVGDKCLDIAAEYDGFLAQATA